MKRPYRLVFLRAGVVRTSTYAYLGAALADARYYKRFHGWSAWIELADAPARRS